MGQPTFFGNGPISALNNTNQHTLTLPANVLQDDIIVVTTLIGNTAANRAGVSSNYQLFARVSGANMVSEWWWKRASAGEANPVMSSSAAPQFGVASVWRGCITSGSPFDTTIAISNNGLETSSAVPTAYSLTPQSRNTLLVSIAGIEDDTAWTVGPPPTNWAARFGVSSSTGTDAQFFCITWNGIPTQSVATPSGSYGTISTAEVWGTATFLLKEPPTYYVLLDDSIYKG